MNDPRDPETGWISPKAEDVMIVAARRGMPAEEIAALIGWPVDRVQSVLLRAYRHELLNDREAMAINLKAANSRAAA